MNASAIRENGSDGITPPFANPSHGHQTVERNDAGGEEAVSVIVMPVPASAPKPNYDHPQLGKPSAGYYYRDASGAILGFVVRFETENGKVILPLTLWRGPDGSLQWAWKGWPAPRPLFNLPGLSVAPDATVLVVEGEKTAKAARDLLPNMAVTTSPGGSNAAHKADWAPLTDRDVVIWPDADAPGASYAEAVADRALAAGARSVRVVSTDGLPEAWDLADPQPTDLDIAARIDQASSWASPSEPEGPPEVEWPAFYAMRPDGLYFQAMEVVPPARICGPFEVLGEARNRDGKGWSIVLAWRDRDQVLHHVHLPRSELLGDGVECFRDLMSAGMDLPVRSRHLGLLKAVLAGVRHRARIRTVTRTGWHGDAFVLPGQTIGGSAETIVLEARHDIARYASAGTLDEWSETVARACAGNSRLILALSVALAGPVVDLLEAEPGGIHFVGPSSCGKSTALIVAGSVWGGDGRNGFAQTWRATGNGLEGIAKAHSGTTLILDELGELSSGEAGSVAYQLMNGQGKARAGRTGEARPRAEWRVMLLSSGEVTLADKIEETGKRAKQGQIVRMVDIPADADAGMGLFENVHGCDPARFATQLKAAAMKTYGTAGPAFVEALAREPRVAAANINNRIQVLLEDWDVTGSDGQVARVAQRFALIAAAGEFAGRVLGLPWLETEAAMAAEACLDAWRRGRTQGPGEVGAAIAAIREAIERHGDARFVKLGDTGNRSSSHQFHVRDVLGYRFEHDDETIFGFTESGWKETLKGIADPSFIARELAARDVLEVTPSEASRSRLAKVVEGKRLRLFAVRSSKVQS
jgi:putative DNA primase/helicase